MTPSQILIAEDENIVAMDIQEALRSARYNVSAVASSGREAIEKAAQTRPDLVLMDIRLKGDMDGVQAATQIRERFDIPVVYLTAYSDDNTVQRAKVTEPFGYLLKPFEKKELHTTIEMALYKHKMDKELKENQRWLAAILRSTGDAVIATDARGVVTFMNPVAEAMTGWTSEALCGKVWMEGIRIYEADDGEPSLRKEFLDGSSGRLSHHAVLTARDGTRRAVDGTLAPTRDDKGRVTGFVLVLRDMTVRKRLEEELQRANQDLERRVQERTETLARVNQELQESESKFRSIAETAPDGVVLADDAGKMVFCNRSTQTLFGTPERELLGQSVLKLIPERFHDSFKTAVRGLSGGGTVHRTIELSGRDKAGREFPVEMSLSTWISRERRLYAGILRDVSERQQAETNLRFQAGILSQVKDAVIVTDAEGRVVYWNRGAERLYGFKTVDAIGLSLDDISAGDGWIPAESREGVEKALTGSDFWHGQAVHRGKSGADLYVELSIGTLRNEEGQSTGRLMVLRDITERKRLEGLLLHSERLAAMGQMAAGIAHELKTPLGVIFGFADVLEQKDPQGEERREMLETLKRQVSRCTNLVDNLLGFSKKGRGSEQPEEDVDVNEMSVAALALVNPHATAKSVTVRKEFAPGPLRARGVKEMFEQVVVNLALNAVDAMAEGGTLTIATRLRREEGKDPRVVIEVSDTGTGIPPALKARLFEPFFTTKGQGTGLGLWLVKQIVTNFRGDITCASEVGKGTLFSISFPAAGA